MPRAGRREEAARRAEIAAERAIVRAMMGEVPAAWALAVIHGEPPPAISDMHRWYSPQYGRDPTTGRALRADGSVNRAGRPPGPYTRNGSSNSGNGNYASSHKRRKYRNSGSYSKTIMRRAAELAAEQAQS
jgi:hypothetical protein